MLHSFILLIGVIIGVKSSYLYYRLYESSNCSPTESFEYSLFINITQDPSGICLFYVNIPNPVRFRTINSSHFEITQFKTSNMDCIIGKDEISKMIVQDSKCILDPFHTPQGQNLRKYSIFENIVVEKIPLTISGDGTKSNLENHEDYVLFSPFSDSNCSKIPPDQSDYSYHKMNLKKYYYLDFDNGWYYPVDKHRPHILFCNNSLFVEYVLNPQNNGEWYLISITKLMYQTISKIPKCQQYRFFKHYFEFSCVSASEVDTSIPKNLYTYQRIQYYFNYQCYGTVFAAKERKTGTCISYGDFTNWVNYYNITVGKTFVQENLDCTGEIYEIHFDIYDTSVQCQEHRVLNAPAYGIMEGAVSPIKKNWKHSDYITTFSVESCDAPQSDFEKWKKEAHDHKEIVYYDSDFCMSSRGEFFYLSKTESLKGYCEGGRLFLQNYTESGNCENSYNVIEGDYCVKIWSKLITCIPNYCDGLAEYDKNVCTGNGNCIDDDVCECTDENYTGKFCEKRIPEKDYTLLISLLSSSTFVVLVFVFVLILFFISCLICSLVCVLCCCCLFCCCFICFLLSCCSCKIFTQDRKLKKFGELDDMYMLLESEKKVSIKSGSSNEIKMNKELYEDIDPKKIKIVKILGEGGSDANVYLCLMENSRHVAFKCFKCRNIMFSQSNYDAFESEAQLLSSLRHPNIIKFFGCFYHPPKIGFLMEYCENGDLFQYISNKKLENQDVPLIEKIRFLHEVSLAMAYLHSKMIVHRDLKCDNVLLDASLNCKLMDFGISRKIQSTQQKKTRHLGSQYYMAPEIVNHSSYNEKCDVFSFAMMIYMIITENFSPYGDETYGIEMRVAGNPYFRPRFNAENVNSENAEESHKVFPEWLKDLTTSNWDHDAKKRNSFSQISQFLSQKKEELKQKNLEMENSEDGSGKLIKNINEPLLEIKAVEKESDIGNNDVSFTGLIIFIKKVEEHSTLADRYLLLERSMKGLFNILNVKYPDCGISRIFVENDEHGIFELYDSSKDDEIRKRGLQKEEEEEEEEDGELLLAIEEKTKPEEDLYYTSIEMRKKLKKINRFSLIHVQLMDDKEKRIKELENQVNERNEKIKELEIKLNEKNSIFVEDVEIN